MKKLLALLLVVLLAAGCAGCAKQPEADAPAGSPAAEQPAGNDEPAASGLLEGPGYATPEEAVLAYVDAMNRGDVDGMLSTFAIETFTDRADPELWLRHTHALKTYSLSKSIPASDTFVRSMIALNRRYLFTESLKGVYIYTAIPDYSARKLGTAEERQALADQLRASPLHDMAGHVEFVRWADPVKLTRGHIADFRTGGDFMEQLAYTGGDDFTELVAELRVNGRLAFQPMTCVRYGGRWYNLEYSTRIAYYAGAKESWKQMFWMPDDDEAAACEQALAAEYPEESARWDALQQSDMAGARWPLASLSVPDVTVCDSAEAAESSDGMAAWAEIHFTRVGGAMITVCVSPALQQQLGTNSPVFRIRFPWAPDGIRTFYTREKRGQEFVVPLFRFYGSDDEDNIALDLENLTAELDGTSVTFTAGGSLQAVFRKPDTAPATLPASAPATSVTGKLEGSGFDTPEDAVLAYLDAMNKGDAGAMLSTLAMETYAAHADPMYYIEMLGTYSPAATYLIPCSDDFGRSLIAYGRACTFSRNLLLAWASYTTNVIENRRLESTADIREFLDQIRQSPLNGLAGNVAFTGWLDAASLMGGDASILANDLAVSGADDITVRVARFTANGHEGILPMRCIRYGDRWYNDWPESRIAYRFIKSNSERLLFWLPEEAELAAVLAASGAK